MSTRRRRSSRDLQSPPLGAMRIRSSGVMPAPAATGASTLPSMGQRPSRRAARERLARAGAAVLVALGGMVCSVAAAAQQWPDGTTRIVAPFAPGSTPDILARLVADRLSKNLGRPFFVEDKPGAGGMIGTAIVARAAADGTTIGVSIGGPLVNDTLLYRSMTYDPFKDLAPVTLAVNQPCVLVASKAMEGAAAADVFAAIGRQPGKYNYASLGNGTVSHLVMVLISDRTRGNLTQVPYPGSGQAVGALIAGEASLGCLPPSSVVPQVKAGNLRLLGIASARRSALFPDVPTLAELGLAGVEANAWIGFIAPARTPAAVIARMQVEIAKALHDPEVAKTLQSLSMEPVGGTPEAFAAYLKEELARWKPIIETHRITLD